MKRIADALGKAWPRTTDLVVEGKTNPDATWYYPSPSDLASSIKDRVAFWKGVQIIEN